ncbi:hypothetical protein C6Y45_05500 [Alkalicoccus saliphilus]|uniref:Uncharacterized protein n=1 Tax=Alkalicoccus saliphilus TaxID=200989 RepID=A0A2T4U7Y0_9BACI|nr:hypothetical protein C6Y45_05500 [Alkalicoccus saliphilus]
MLISCLLKLMQAADFSVSGVECSAGISVIVIIVFQRLFVFKPRIPYETASGFKKASIIQYACLP